MNVADAFFEMRVAAFDRNTNTYDQLMRDLGLDPDTFKDIVVAQFNQQQQIMLDDGCHPSTTLYAIAGNMFLAGALYGSTEIPDPGR